MNHLFGFKDGTPDERCCAGILYEGWGEGIPWPIFFVSHPGHWHSDLKNCYDVTLKTWQIFGILPYTRTAPLNLVGFCSCNSLKVKPVAGNLSLAKKMCNFPLVKSSKKTIFGVKLAVKNNFCGATQHFPQWPLGSYPFLGMTSYPIGSMSGMFNYIRFKNQPFM